MTDDTYSVGQMRARYDREVEARPSRFFEPALYREWAERADTWGREQA